MQLTLLVPGLLLPDEIRADTVFDLSTPALSLFLGRAARRDQPAHWLAGAFHVPVPLPLAALRKVSAGATAAATAGEWICLDPVHLLVGRESVTLADPGALALTPDEDAALRAAVAPVFAVLGTLSASAPGRWELLLREPAALDTVPLPEAVGHAVGPDMPGGDAGRVWRLLLAEAQTVMHAHPVNRNRDALGRPTINSLWPWGAGTLGAQAPQAAYDVVWSDDPALQGLCALAGLPCIAPPERFQPASGRVLALLDSLARPAREFDALAWRERLLALEQRWFAPALAALRRSECEPLRVIGMDAGAQDAAAFELTRAAAWRFWRRPRPLTELA